MPAHHNIDNDSKCIITTWQGTAGDGEFIEAIKSYQKNIKSHPKYNSYNEIFSLGTTTDIKLTIGGIKKLGEIATKQDQKSLKTKLAIVVTSNLAFGLARMYAAYRSFHKNANKDVKVFKSVNQAIDWLDQAT